ncbi:MAG: MaoC/PaaZ C-terminal domain-containing protein [Actinomycetota bacterium]
MTELRPGAELQPRERVVVREDVKAYADASGDQNPLHQDDVFARSVGFPGVIAHGMFTMGHLTSSVGEWLGPGAELRSMHAQFRSAVLLGDTIVAGGRVRDVDPEAGTVSLELWVTVDREGTLESPIKRAEAVASIVPATNGRGHART